MNDLRDLENLYKAALETLKIEIQVGVIFQHREISLHDY